MWLFPADTSIRLNMILASEEHILSLENGKKRFMDEVTSLSRAFAIAIPHDDAEVIEELIRLGKEIQKMDKEPGEMGMSGYEYAL